MTERPGWSLADWDLLPTATISDCLDRSAAMDSGIRLLSGERVVGPAYTVRASLGDSALTHRALAGAPPGHVIVVAAEGSLTRAVWGGVLSEAAAAAGIVGAVIDGVIRDLSVIRAFGFPVWGRGTCPAGPLKRGPGAIGVAVSVGGVVIAPGDLIVGDADGIVVVPAARIPTVLDEVRERMRLEEEWLERIRAGETSAHILGLE